MIKNNIVIIDIHDPYNLIIIASLVIILSFLFGALSEKTNIPSVLMLIVLGIIIKLGLDAMGLSEKLHFLSILEVLGIVGHRLIPCQL